MSLPGLLDFDGSSPNTCSSSSSNPATSAPIPAARAAAVLYLLRYAFGYNQTNLRILTAPATVYEAATTPRATRAGARGRGQRDAAGAERDGDLLRDGISGGTSNLESPRCCRCRGHCACECAI
ncbi:unnamed protein product [Pieris brassicae]|uniref:Uncharacterized protein n=1 Tax=Pieris brassicae TaxID=7116 RepID=A0A9P0SY77_PIEBR|nr:unnamed protein product [Pieris brassicae]